IRVERMRPRIDVAEDGSAPGSYYCCNRWHTSVRRDQYVVVRLNAQCQQPDPERVGPGADAHRLEPGRVIRRELSLECLQRRPHEEPSAVEDPSDGFIQLGPNRPHT